MYKYLFPAIAAFFLSACGPIYETQYQIVSPRTMEGRMCANNCLLAQTNCQQHCQMASQQCEYTERLEAENDYLRYVEERRRKGREIKRSEESFYSGYACDDDDCVEQCAGNYHLCHTNCGGQVIATTVCTAFCE